MSMTTEDWIIASNFLVVGSSLIVAGTTEHDAIKAMRDTTIALIRSITHMNNPTPKEIKDVEKDEQK